MSSSGANKGEDARCVGLCRSKSGRGSRDQPPPHPPLYIKTEGVWSGIFPPPRLLRIFGFVRDPGRMRENGVRKTVVYGCNTAVKCGLGAVNVCGEWKRRVDRNASHQYAGTLLWNPRWSKAGAQPLGGGGGVAGIRAHRRRSRRWGARGKGGPCGSRGTWSGWRRGCWSGTLSGTPTGRRRRGESARGGIQPPATKRR